MEEKITIRDIARLAGVSKSTVSRVLNQKSDVDVETRERILHIMEEQAFLPSITASKLAGGRSRMIGVLTPSLAWPLIPEIMSGVSEMVIQSPYELLLYSISREQDRNEKDQRDVIDRILSTNLAASLLAVFPGQSTQYLVTLYEQGFPIVIIDDQEQLTSIPHVSADNRKGAYKATRYLLQLGHHRIGHIQGPQKFLVSQERHQGYSEALREAGITPDPGLIVEGDFMPESGRACARKLFALDDPPTAIFAASDQMAYGVLETAEESGLRVPEDLSLIGFDDIAPSAHMRPALTTVRQPFYEMGQRAVALLLSLLETPRPPSSRKYPGTAQPPVVALLDRPGETLHFQLTTYLVVRASCSIPSSLSIHYRR
ncbi:MAG TPA: LacI family DNA-binding transcriptional regulator [Ktedonobacteraceae bacterium]|jgi:LacI family transcriptional regulator|nr:LacI family DNA-binding transcriptional regulator [Ktedonobacteraceae bacterium]